MKALIILSLLATGCSTLERRGIEVLETAVFGRVQPIEPKVTVNPVVHVQPVQQEVVVVEKKIIVEQEPIKAKERLIFFYPAPGYKGDSQ